MRYLLMDEQAGKKKKVTFDFDVNVWSCILGNNDILDVGNITHAPSNIIFLLSLIISSFVLSLILICLFPLFGLGCFCMRLSAATVLS